MPHDARKYAVITHDFADSPKLQILPVEARWAYLEMILYSARMRTDGRLSKRLASARWGLDVCQLLLDNDPVNPSLEIDGEDYVIHDFLEHQTSKAEIESLSEKRRKAGRKGGKAKAEALKRGSKQTASKPLANAKANAKQTASKSSSKPLANLKQKKKKKGEGGQVFATATAVATDAETPPSNLDELAAAYAASQPDTCPRHPDGNPTNEPCWHCGQIRKRKKQAEQDATARARAERRAAIDACDLCDDNGIRMHNGTATRCTHTNPHWTPPKTRLEAPQTDKQPNRGQSVQNNNSTPQKPKEPPF